MNELQIFENEEFGSIRTIEIDGEPWFVGKDIAVALEYKNTTVALQDNVEEEDKVVTKVSTLGGTQNTTVINESGMYSLIFGSRMEKAKKFKHWVTSEVIPSIRKTGSYNMPQTYAEALRALADKAEEAERLALENKEMQPKAEFFDAVADSKTALPMDQVAKVLQVKGYGRNKLFEFLRDNGVLDSKNVPYQRFVDAGWFRTIEQHYQNGYEPCISIKTLVYQKGVDGIRKLLQKKG